MAEDVVDVRAVQKAVREKYAADPDSSRVTLRATAKKHPDSNSPFLCEIEARETKMESAAHEAISIRHHAPCSGELLLGALAACAQTSVQVIANAMKIDVKHCEVYVDGDLDFRGTLGMSRTTAVGFTAIRVRFEIDAPDATPEQLRSLHEKVERYCIIQQTFSKPPTVESEWLHGVDVPTLHQFVFSPSCEKVRRAFHHKGLRWHTIEVDWFDRAPLIAVSAQSMTPYFEHKGAKLGPDSMAIVDYIEDNFAGPTLYPDGTRAKCHEINEYVESEMFPIAKKAFFPYAAAEMKRASFEADVVRICGASSETLRAELAHTADAYRPHLERFERDLAARQWIAGPSLSAADHIVYSNYWFAMNNVDFRAIVERFSLPRFTEWAERMRGILYTKIPF